MNNRLNQSIQTSLSNRILRITIPVAIGLAAILAVMGGGSNDISGVINQYAKVTAVGTNTVTVDNSAPFSIGDRILIIQMKGASISTSDDSTYGDISTLSYAGNYEFGEVGSISGSVLTLEYDLCKTYDPNHAVQVVLVPEYEDVRVNGTLTADPWDGEKGGIAVIWATNEVTLHGDVDVSGLGFEGGSFNGSATSGGLTYTCTVNSGKGGKKGEGVVETADSGCRGKQATGGGGGNDHNGGGGGGSNYGAGGKGGDGWKSNSPGNLSDVDKGGRGGFALETLYDNGISRLFLGGGGGGGHQNNGASYPGGSGGGIIIIVADQLKITTNASLLNASGDDAQDIYINDGASGGGGGGSVLLDVETFHQPSKLTINVSGGDGADLHTKDQHGPGGGGGGGLINSGIQLPASITKNLSGGVAGLFISSNTNNPYHNTSHGAAAGEAGAILENLVIQECSNPPVLDLDNTNTGNDYSKTIYLGDGAEGILESPRITIQDADDIEMSSATIEIINPMDGSDESLLVSTPEANLTSYGLTATVAASGHRVFISGGSSFQNYGLVMAGIQYQNGASSPDLTDRMISINVNDGGANSNDAYVTLLLQNISFPVEWLYVSVDQIGNDAKLSWGTGSELNADKFQIERSGDGLHFDGIGEISANGTTTEASSYEFNDAGVVLNNRGTIYYRLKQLDFDGQYQYSEIASLRLEGGNAGLGLVVSPNPARDFVRIEATGILDQSKQVEVLSISGQRMYSGTIEAGQGRLELQISNWTPGTYIIQLRQNRDIATKKLIVK